MNGLGLFLSEDELTRARTRIASDQEPWKAIAGRLADTADKLLAEGLLDQRYDTAWFDKDPYRSFAETYGFFHDFCAPAVKAADRAMTLGRAGQLFQRDDLLDAASEALMHLVEHFPFHVRHHDSGLRYSHFATVYGDLYGILHDRLSQTQRGAIRAALDACGQAMCISLEHWTTELAYMPYNNHLAHHQKGLMACGVVLGNDAWITGAMEGIGSPAQLLPGCVTDDGLCYESSTLYHFGTAAGLFQNAEITRHLRPYGRNLYEETCRDGRTLKQMYDAPLGMLMPDGSRPAFGDCYASRPIFMANQAGNYERAYAIWGDPRHAWLLTRIGKRDSLNALLYGVDDVPAGQAPANGSRLWIEHGWAMVSSRRGECFFSDAPGGFAAATTGDLSGIHHHRDKFTLHLVADGRTWISDAEAKAVSSNGFSEPIQEQFNRSAWAHSQLIVNGQEQNTLDAPLSFVRFRDHANLASAALADKQGRVYDGVAQLRSLTVTEQFCLDVYCAESRIEAASLDLSFQPVCDAIDFGVALAPADRPTECPCPVLDDFLTAPCPDGFNAEMSQNGKKLAMSLRAYVGDDASPVESLELHSASWPKVSDGSGGRGRMYFARVKNQSRVIFATLYHLNVEGEPAWAIESLQRRYNGSHDELLVTLTCGDRRQSFLLPCAQRI